MAPPRVHLPVVDRHFVRIASLRDVPVDGGIAVKYGHVELAIFRVAGEVYATQNQPAYMACAVALRPIGEGERAEDV